MRSLIAGIILLAVFTGIAHAQVVPTSGPAVEQKWFYLSTNMLVDKSVQADIALIERAAKAGYNGVLLTDSKFMTWDIQSPKYFANVAKVRDACRKNHIACIAAVCPVGYCEGILAHDPNLAEGLPVVDAPFVVAKGKLVPADDGTAVANGSFEQYKGNSPAGWKFIDEPGKISFIDTDVKADGKACLRMQDIGTVDPKNGHGRACQSIAVKPFHYYHLSMMVKTQDFQSAGDFQIELLGKAGDSLNFYQPPVSKTQDFKQIDLCFNSLDNSELNLYIGVWGGKGGKIWLDDVRIAPAGLVNVIRRDGAPLKATSADGKTVYVEGKDFAKIADPMLGNQPWRGEFTIWHAQPEIAIPAGSSLTEGQRVLLSYYHPAIIYRDQLMVCMNEPKVNEILQWQIQQVHKNVQPDGYFMSHDEIRSQGWDDSCIRAARTPGATLAENVKRCTEMIQKEDPGKPIYVWSDMFDPNHNARKTGRYYMVKGDGPWYESWKGLSKDVIVANWRQNNADSLAWFAGMGNRQILAGYYDADPQRIVAWLDKARRARGVIGVIYTTWQDKYGDLEAFMKAVQTVDRP